MTEELLSGKVIGFIGAGNMAEAVVRGLLRADAVRPQQLAAADIDENRLEWMRETFGISIVKANTELVAASDIVILAVKPQVVQRVLEEIGDSMGPSKLLISFVAGLSQDAIRARVAGQTRVIRVVPNTPATVSEAMSCIASDGPESPRDLETARSIFATVGRTLPLPEHHMDAVTALSGSGPAYVFLIAEALADGGVRMGLPRPAAAELAAQTLLGAARLLLESGAHPGQLKDQVTSPGGTTIAGLHRLERGGVRAALMDAVQAAAERSVELGQMAK
ncbi:MAG: pyrroline-5-carboxylate reductase [Desulfobacteraceae bacterium]|nr:pyrroline-5-carboxylate reductase [Desulfobacteraceae bacterium]